MCTKLSSVKMAREIGFEGVNWINLDNGPVAGYCVHGNETNGFINVVEFLDYLNSALWSLVSCDID